MQNENGSSGGAVFVQTNEADANRVLAFRRAADGQLSGLGSHRTGGRGDGVPHLTSQGSVVLTGDRGHLLVTNAGSDELSLFALGAQELELVATVATGGAGPKSVAERDGLVYVLNADAPSLAGFRLAGERLESLGEPRDLAAGADPAQVGFSPDGSTLVVTERGTNSIVLHPVSADGQLGEPAVTSSSGPTPYGFAFAGEALVVTEAFGAETGKAAASSYVVQGLSAKPVSRSVGNGRSEICWAVVATDGRYAFTTNFADGAVSCYSIGADGTLALDEAVAAKTVEGRPGLRDEGLSSDGRFLYAIDADSGRIFGWSVDHGRLSEVGSWPGVPATVAGLAAS
jgi:6-phosphogluconolactonase (cycloisomerase 2 family)